jgi:hypothetical protein
MFFSQVQKKALGDFTSKMWKKIFKKKGKIAKPLNTFVPNVEDKISSGWLIHSSQCGRKDIGQLLDVFLLMWKRKYQLIV